MTALRTTAALLLALVPFAVCGPAAAKETPAEALRVWNGRDKSKEVKAWTKEYLGAGESRRAEIRAALDELGTLALKDVKKQAKAMLKIARKEGPQLTKKSGQVFTFEGLSGPIQVLGAKKKKPLFIALHGGGKGVGDGKSAMQKWSLAGGKCIVIAPTTPEKLDSAWNQPKIERWVLALIDAAKRTWDVDTNRIYVAGHSMGGYGTWSIGGKHADRFAALSPGAGGLFGMRTADGVRIAPGIVPNLLNTPIWFYNSTDDKQVSYKTSHAADLELKALEEKGLPYEWKYDEYTDIGHGLPPKGLKPIVDWMLEKKRDPHPKWVIWEPTQPHKRRFAWLGRESGASRIAGRIEARIEGNTITLSGGGATTVYLSPELVDLAKPVVIKTGEKVLFEGVVPARLSVLLDSVAALEDPKQYYCASVTVP